MGNVVLKVLSGADSLDRFELPSIPNDAKIILRHSSVPSEYVSMNGKNTSEPSAAGFLIMQLHIVSFFSFCANANSG